MILRDAIVLFTYFVFSGKAFALLSVADTSMPIISGPIYTYVYNSTINFAPATIFLVTIVSQMTVFGSTL